MKFQTRIPNFYWEKLGKDDKNHELKLRVLWFVSTMTRRMPVPRSESSQTGMMPKRETFAHLASNPPALFGKGGILNIKCKSMNFSNC